MSLRVKLVLPVVVIGTLCLLYLWLGWHPVSLPAAELTAVRVAAASAFALVAAAVWVLAGRLVMHPLQALGAGAAPTFAALEQRLAELEHSLVQRRSKIEALEAALADPERTARPLRQDATLDAAWEWDVATGVMHLSPRWKDMLGFKPEEFSDAYAAWKNRVHLADIARVEAALKSHLDGTTPRFESEHRLLHKDASHRWVLSRATAIRDAQARAQRVVGLDVDVTSFKRMEEVLTQVAEGTSAATGEEFFRQLVRNLAAAVGVRTALVTQCQDFPTTRLRTLACWSADAFRDNFEYELAGTPCETVIQSGVARFYADNLRTAFAQDKALNAESYYGMPVVGSDGAVIGHLALMDDKPMDSSVALSSIYRIFSARAAAEMARRHLERSLAKLATELEPLGREERVRHIARLFAELIGAREAIVTECVQVPHKRLRVLAWWRDGRYEPYTEYNLVGTTCEETIDQGRICFYPHGVGERFPPARPFDRESYLGVPCFGAERLVIGHVAGFHNKPLPGSLPQNDMLQLFAQRAALELVHLRSVPQ